jgi:broad-specificity NMP kinase
MKIILVGIEYVGTTTIAKMLKDWKLKYTGSPFYDGLMHDHMKIPHTSGHPDDTTLKEQEQILNLSPKLMEMYHRYHMYYHLHHYFQRDDLTVGFHIEESILARRYFGYGLDGEAFDRENIVFERIENRIKQITSDPIIIVHMAADVSVIENRMASLRNTPEHTNSPLLKDDIELVLKDYDHYVNKSDIGPTLQVDTSIDTPEQTLEKIVDLIKPFISHEDMKKN